MRAGYWFAGMVFCFALAASASLAAPTVDVDFSSCRRQLEALLRLDVDCVIDIRPGASGDIPPALRPLIAGMACRVPLKLRKAQVYGEWIQDTGARSPDFAVTCSLGTGDPADRISGSIRFECVRSGPAWSCFPVLHDVNGLGVLGRVLEGYVNTNAQLRETLTNALNPR